MAVDFLRGSMTQQIVFSGLYRFLRFVSLSSFFSDRFSQLIVGSQVETLQLEMRAR